MITIIIIIVTSLISIAAFKDRKMFDALSMKPYRTVHNNEWYRIITHGFVHGDYVHLLINMLVFYSFGAYVEDYLKVLSRVELIGNPELNYLLLYFGGMVTASLYDLVKRRNNPGYASIGASGAVSAVLFASIFFAPWNKIYFFGVLPIPGIVFGALYLGYSQYMSKKGGDNINHLAHFYGAVFGLLFPMMMNPALIRQFLSNF